jgi:thioredoxin 1
MRILALVIVSVGMVGFLGCSASSKKEAGTNEKNAVHKTGILYAEDMKTFNDIINGNQPVLVDFYADWCAPCRMMAPILEQVAGNMQGEVKILKVDVDKNRDAAMKYGVRSIPTLILFKNGEVKWQGVGVIQADQIQQIVKTKS